MFCPIGQEENKILVLSYRPPGQSRIAGQDTKTYPVLSSDTERQMETNRYYVAYNLIGVNEEG